MSRRAQRWALGLAFFGLVPVPFILAATGFAPPVRVLFLASVLGALAVTDGAAGPMPIFIGILFTQLAFYLALAYFTAGFALRLIHRLAPERFVSALVVATVVSLLWLSSFDVYHTPHSSSGPYSNLTGLLD